MVTTLATPFTRCAICLLLVVPLSQLLLSCGSQDCTLIGCDDDTRFTVYVISKAGAASDLIPGTYIVQGTQDGINVTYSCTIGLSLADGRIVPDLCNETVGGSRIDIYIAQNRRGGTSIRVDVEDVGPDGLTISVTRDGMDLGTQTFKPEYPAFYPNGADCPPKCLTPAPDENMSV